MNTWWRPYDHTLDTTYRKEVIGLMRIFLFIIPSVALVLAIANFILGFSDIGLTTLLVPIFCLIALFFLNRGRINVSVVIVISIMIISTTIICLLSGRIHEVGIIIFPVIIFFSSLVMNVRGMALTTSAVILVLAFLVFGEVLHLLPDRSLQRGWIDLAVVLAVLVVHTFMTFSFSEITRNNLGKVHEELENQKRFKQEIAENLEEKTELLRLVHHRVKNNLLLINSLIELEAYDTPELKNEIKEITERIHAIARAHDPLYHTEDYKQVAIKPYFEKLITSFVQKNNIKALQVTIEDCLIYHERALLLGIILQKTLSSIQSLETIELSIDLVGNTKNLELSVESKNQERLILNDNYISQVFAKRDDGKLEITPKKIKIILT